LPVFPASSQARRLTEQEKSQFHEWGYVKSLPLFDAETVESLQHRFGELVDLLPKGIDINQLNNWHKANRWIYDLCRTPAILDYVEDLVGPNFFQWGAHFFCKFPGGGSVVPWHQDAQYWPLQPRKTVTIWLAVFDTDEDNGAMRVVKASHQLGTVGHHTVQGDHYVLEQEVDEGGIDQDQVVTLDMKAGEISLHDDGLIHGSVANRSDRIRAGLTMRYSPTEVKCDVKVWPTFESYLTRGVDSYEHNPAGKVPTGHGFPVRKFQASSDFA